MELDLKYQKDIGSMTSRVERCVEQVTEMTGFFKTIKGRMKELQSAQQQVMIRVVAMETFTGSLESKFDVIAADIQDFDLTLCDTQPGAVWGMNEEFVSCARTDNQVHCFTAMEALINHGAKAEALAADCGKFVHLRASNSPVRLSAPPSRH